jgi:hypothetical protein
VRIVGHGVLSGAHASDQVSILIHCSAVNFQSGSTGVAEQCAVDVLLWIVFALYAKVTVWPEIACILLRHMLHVCSAAWRSLQQRSLLHNSG